MDPQNAEYETEHDLRRMAAEVVSAYVSANTLSTAELPDVIRRVFVALKSAAGQAEEPKAEPLKPAVGCIRVC